MPQHSDRHEVAQHARDQPIVEPVMAGLDRRMRGEHALHARLRQIEREIAFRAGRRLRMAAQQGQRQQGGVALIEVIGLDLEAERPEQALAADPEDDFL